MKIFYLITLSLISFSSFSMNNSLQEQVQKQLELNRDLGIAAQTGNLFDVIRLIEEGADPVSTSMLANQGGSTPLFKAAWAGHLEVVTYLVGCGANINELDASFGINPFHAACMEGRLEVVKFLAQNGADIHMLDKRGNNAYYLAERRAHDNIQKFIYKFDEEQFNAQKKK